MSIKMQIKLLKRRRTRIVATVGPASADPAVLGQLTEAGVNVFRLNMFHGDYDFHRSVFEHIHRLAGSTDLPVAVLADLCDPKIRTGCFRDGLVDIKAGTSPAA